MEQNGRLSSNFLLSDKFAAFEIFGELLKVFTEDNEVDFQAQAILRKIEEFHV